VDGGSRSGAEVREALENGAAVNWQFDPNERRLSFTLPKEFGGRTHEVCVTGGYTFTPISRAVAA